MACVQNSNKTWLRDRRSKLGNTTASQSISRDAVDAGQCMSCSMAITTRCDFDCVHEVSSKSLAINYKKNGFHSFNRDPEQPAIVQKSSSNTCPHSKHHNFAIWHGFATQFSRQAPPWSDLSIGMFTKAIAPASSWEKWKQEGQNIEFQWHLKGLNGAYSSKWRWSFVAASYRH